MRAAVSGLLALLVGIAPAVAQPVAPSQQPPPRSCFLITEMRGWKAPDNRTIFIRVGLDQVYRLDLAATCPLLTMPETHLITRTRGPDLVCSAIDWDLSVAEPPPTSMPMPCIVKQMTLLTPEDVAAIAPKYRP